MDSIKVLPEFFCFENLSTVGEYSHCKIFKDEIILKEYSTEYYDLSVFQNLISLSIPGYLFPFAMYQSKDSKLFYLLSLFLKNYESLDFYVSHSSCMEVFLLFKKILLNLANAHKFHYNPYDIFPNNFVVGKNGNVWNIDCDLSFYQKIFTSDDDLETVVYYFDSYFKKNFDHIDLSFNYLNFYDKLQVLSMLFYYLKYGDLTSYCDELVSYSKLKSYVEEFLHTNEISSVHSYLANFLEKGKVSEDDYFISNLIDPLLSFYETRDFKKSL